MVRLAVQVVLVLEQEVDAKMVAKVAMVVKVAMAPLVEPVQRALHTSMQ